MSVLLWKILYCEVNNPKLKINVCNLFIFIVHPHVFFFIPVWLGIGMFWHAIGIPEKPPRTPWWTSHVISLVFPHVCNDIEFLESGLASIRFVYEGWNYLKVFQKFLSWYFLNFPKCSQNLKNCFKIAVVLKWMGVNYPFMVMKPNGAWIYGGKG